MNKRIFIPCLLFFLSGCSIINPITQADCFVRKVVDYDKEDFYSPPKGNYKTSIIFNSGNGEVYDYDGEFHKKLIRLNGRTEKDGLIKEINSYVKDNILYFKKISNRYTNRDEQDKVILVLNLSKKTYYLNEELLERFSWKKLYREEGVCKLVKPKITEVLK